MNGSNYVKIPLISNAILNFENNDEYCFIWSILVSLHHCKINHPNRVSNYRKFFDNLNIQDFDFTKGFKCNVDHRFNELNNLSTNIFEINFYQDQNKWKHKFLPVEVSKKNSDRVIDLLIHKNQCAPKKNNCIFRRSSENFYL